MQLLILQAQGMHSGQGCLRGIAMGKDLETGAKMGAVAAVYAIEKYGTQEHCFSYDDFSQRYRSNFGEM